LITWIRSFLPSTTFGSSNFPRIDYVPTGIFGRWQLSSVALGGQLFQYRVQGFIKTDVGSNVHMRFAKIPSHLANRCCESPSRKYRHPAVEEQTGELKLLIAEASA
jgi:hypothetical protein